MALLNYDDIDENGDRLRLSTFIADVACVTLIIEEGDTEALVSISLEDAEKFRDDLTTLINTQKV